MSVGIRLIQSQQSIQTGKVLGYRPSVNQDRATGAMAKEPSDNCRLGWTVPHKLQCSIC